MVLPGTGEGLSAMRRSRGGSRKMDGSFIDTAITVGNCFGEIWKRVGARIKFSFWMKRHAEEGWNMTTPQRGLVKRFSFRLTKWIECYLL